MTVVLLFDLRWGITRGLLYNVILLVVVVIFEGTALGCDADAQLPLMPVGLVGARLGEVEVGTSSDDVESATADDLEELLTILSDESSKKTEIYFTI